MKGYLVLIILWYMLFSPLFATNNMSVIAEFQGEHHNSKFGYQIESLDYNHDGYTDLVVFSHSFGYAAGVSGSRGKVYIYHGGSSFNSDTSPSVTLEGTTTRVLLYIFNAGDINGDGFEDLCIYDYSPQPSHEDRKLSFYFGGNESLDNPDHVISIPYNSIVLRVSKMGDFDGDGYDDVGLHYDLSPPHIKKFSVMWGGSFEEHVVLEYQYNNAISSISGVGDLDGDGYRDFALGFTNPDPETGYHMIRIFHGNPERDLSDFDILIQTQEPITKDSRPIGDVNGDGFDDFMGFYSNAGMHAWLGGEFIDYNTPSFNITPGWSGDEASRCLKYGDLNGDGFDDVIGTNYYQRKFSVWMGSEQMNGTSDLIVSRTSFDNFGYGIATGDFNADGYCDVAISAPKPEYSNSPNFPGYLWIYAGNHLLEDTSVNNDDPLLLPPPQLSIRVFPNPLRREEIVQMEIKTLSAPQGDQAILRIFNSRGQQIYHQEHITLSGKSTTLPLQLQGLANGVYICQLQHGHTVTTTKITIMK